MFLTILWAQPSPRKRYKHTRCGTTDLLRPSWPLPHSRQLLPEQLDDVATVKTDVVCAGHAALHHHSVPARHLEAKHRPALHRFSRKLNRAAAFLFLSPVGRAGRPRQSPICWRSRWPHPSPPDPHRSPPSGQEAANLLAKRLLRPPNAAALRCQHSQSASQQRLS